MINFRRSAVLSGVALAASLAGAVLSGPAAFAAPRLPSGCVFDQSTGLTTCTTTTAIDTVESAATIGQDVFQGYTTDGSGAAALCLQVDPVATAYVDQGSLDNGWGPVIVTGQGAATTTTTYQGASVGKGSKPVSTVTHSTVTYTQTSGWMECRPGLDGSPVGSTFTGASVTVTN